MDRDTTLSKALLAFVRYGFRKATMDDIARVAERNAGAIDGVEASIQRQVTLMTEMVASSKSMTELAESQRGALRRFQTGAPATGPEASEVDE